MKTGSIIALAEAQKREDALRADLKKCGDDCRAVLADSLAEVERLLRAVENQTEIALRYLTRAEVAEAEVERLREEAVRQARIANGAMIEAERLNRAIVAHHEMSTLSDEAIAEAYGTGGTGACPICRRAALGETEAG